MPLIAIEGVMSVSVAAGAGRDVIVGRQQYFKQMGAAQKAIVDDSKKSSPDLTMIAAQADKLKALSLQLPR